MFSVLFYMPTPSLLTLSIFSSAIRDDNSEDCKELEETLETLLEAVLLLTLEIPFDFEVKKSVINLEPVDKMFATIIISEIDHTLTNHLLNFLKPFFKARVTQPSSPVLNLTFSDNRGKQLHLYISYQRLVNI